MQVVWAGFLVPPGLPPEHCQEQSLCPELAAAPEPSITDRIDPPLQLLLLLVFNHCLLLILKNFLFDH